MDVLVYSTIKNQPNRKRQYIDCMQLSY